MATAKQKRALARLEEIKQDAARIAAESKDPKAANLAEEAAGLALELHEQEGGK